MSQSWPDREHLRREVSRSAGPFQGGRNAAYLASAHSRDSYAHTQGVIGCSRTAAGVHVRQALGRIGTQKPASPYSATVRSGLLHMNPAEVEIVLDASKDPSSESCQISVRAWALEGLISQHTATRAIRAVLESLTDSNVPLTVGEIVEETSTRVRTLPASRVPLLLGASACLLLVVSLLTSHLAGSIGRWFLWAGFLLAVSAILWRRVASRAGGAPRSGER